MVVREHKRALDLIKDFTCTPCANIGKERKHAVFLSQTITNKIWRPLMMECYHLISAGDLCIDLSLFWREFLCVTKRKMGQEKGVGQRNKGMNPLCSYCFRLQNRKSFFSEFAFICIDTSWGTDEKIVEQLTFAFLFVNAWEDKIYCDHFHIRIMDRKLKRKCRGGGGRGIRRMIVPHSP